MRISARTHARGYLAEEPRDLVRARDVGCEGMSVCTLAAKGGRSLLRANRIQAIDSHSHALGRQQPCLSPDLCRGWTP
jgi:hypothetical protein